MNSDASAGGLTVADPRDLLGQLFAQAIATIRGDVLIRQMSRVEGDRWICKGPGQTVSMDLPPGGRIIVVGAGKAAASLAKGLEEQLGDRINDGCIIVKYDHLEDLRHIRQIEAGHPVPDENSLRGTRELLDTLTGLTPDDRVFVLVTGGASALMIAPTPGISLADKATVTNLLLRTQASIEEINTVRQALSLVKGGRLLERIAPASAMTLLVSDIPSGDVARIGSGPTIPPPEGADPLEIFARFGLTDQLPDNVVAQLAQNKATPSAVPVSAQSVLLADNSSLVAEIERRASDLGIPVRRVDTAMHGDTHGAARNFATAMKDYAQQGLDRPCLFLSAGETTLEVHGKGMGGRNQEFALVAARHLAEVPGCTVLSAGTDGTDGPTPAAGGFGDSTSCARAAAAGLNLDASLADNDSYHLLEALGDLYMTGPTGTNVMDVVLGLVA